MRKLRFACLCGAAHYRAAAHAITDIGNTQGFRRKNHMIGDAEIEWGTRTMDVSYMSTFCEDREEVNTTVSTTGCVSLFVFDWPKLRLLSMKLVSCTCEDSSRPTEY